MRKVTYTSQAIKGLRSIGSVAADRVMNKVDEYSQNPSAFANQVKKLKGSQFLRLRIGDYRVLFTEDGVVVVVMKVGHRREVYD